MATSSGNLKDELPTGIIMEESNSYCCQYCSCVLAGFSCMQQHVAGKRHKKEMQRSGIIIPPKKEIAQVNVIQEDTTISSEAVNASSNTNGIVECEKKWNTFQCVYCNCILNAGDVNLHIGGKRHKKRANQAALENFISKRNEKNDPKPVEIVAGRTENTANFEEGKNDPLSKSPMPAWQQIPECSMEELDDAVKRKNIVSISKEAEKDNFSHPTSCSRTSDLPSNNEEFKLDANKNLEKASKVSADENIRHTKESAEQSTNSSRSSVVPAMNSSPETKNVSEATTSKITAQQTSASIIAAPQVAASGKTTLQMNTSSSDIAQSNASANDTLLGNISPKATSQTSVLAKSTVCTNSSEKTSLQTDADTSVKTVSQKNILLMTSDTKPLVKATQQLDTSVKAVSLIDNSVKVASQQNSSVKAIPPTNAAEKTTPQKNASVKTSSPQAKTFQQKTASLKADPQMRAPLRVSQLSSSLNEYLTMVSKPIVGLNYVVETLVCNKQSRFQCNLCKVNGNDHVMKEHINSTKHYLEYLRTVDPINAAEVTPLKETERNQKILELVTELERKKGRGTILVKTAETEKDNKDDLLTTGDTTRKEYAGYALRDAGVIGSAINIVAQEFLSKDVIRNAQKRDPNTSKIIKELMDGVQNSSYIMHDDILYERRNGKYRVVVAKTMKQAIYESYHFSLCRKTPGAVTYINDSYSWSGINEDITKFAKQCYVCQIRKLRQLSGGEAIPILVRRGQAKRKPSPTKRAFNDLTNAEIEDSQRRDPDTMKVISDTENGLETNQHVIYENILYILEENGQYKIVVSPQMKKLLFEKNHSVLCWKSTERPPIINAITQVYFWQRMLEEVKLFAAKCKKCRTNIPVKRISEQVSTTPSGKTLKKSTEKIKDTETKDAPKEKNQDVVTKDTSKERTRDEPKEKSSRNIPWDKTKSLKPPIFEQKILTKDMVRDAQKKDSNTSKIIKLLTDGVPSSSYILYEGILYQEKNGKYLTMVADKMKQSIYEKYHSTLCSRYTGRSSQRDGTKYINRAFFWPAMSQDIYIFVKNCHVCQIRTLRTKAFSRPSEERRNNEFLISASISAFNDLTDGEITAAQRKDPGTLKLIKLIEDGMHISRHILYEGILYCLGGHGDYKVVISHEMKETIYQNNHFLLCWESTVWQSTVDTIAQVYLWPRIHEDIRDFMETCQVCKREFPEQSYMDQLAYTASVPEGDKNVGVLMEQYHQTYPDPTYCATQQYQNNYPVQPIDPYAAAANSATYSYGTYPQYWNTSAGSEVTYPTLGSGKRPADDDTDSNIKEHSTFSYNERKRHRSDLGTEYEYSRSQNDRRPPTAFKAQEPLDQTVPLAASEFNKPNEPENSNNTFGFTITNSEDAEVTLDIINSLMHIYLKYQLKKLHGPVQKLLQESLKEKETKESADSNTNNATKSDTHELFVRLPRLHKGKKTEVKQSTPYPANSGRISSSSLGQHPYNKNKYILPETSVLKSSRSFNPSFPSRNDTVDSLSSKKSDLPKTSSFFPKKLHSTDVDKTSTLNDDIDGIPMTGEIPDRTDKVSCNWEDDIDGKPLITESSSKISKKHNVASIHNSPKKIDNVKDFPVRCMTNPSLNKPLKNKDDDIDGIPLGSRTNKSLDCSTNKLEGGSNDSKDGPFLKPSSSNIFKKPPDDWDKNANKTVQAVKGSSLTKSQSNFSESSDDVILDTKTLPDKYPNWKKGGMQGGTSFYNSPLYNKANEGVASTSSTAGNNAPVIDLFKRYRRVQL